MTKTDEKVAPRCYGRGVMKSNELRTMSVEEAQRVLPTLVEQFRAKGRVADGASIGDEFGPIAVIASADWYDTLLEVVEDAGGAERLAAAMREGEQIQKEREDAAGELGVSVAPRPQRSDLEEALQRFQAAAMALDRAWSPQGGDAITDYPEYLPDFAEFTANVQAMQVRSKEAKEPT